MGVGTHLAKWRAKWRSRHAYGWRWSQRCKGLGGPGGDAGAEEVVVVGPDPRTEGECAGHRRPITRIAQRPGTGFLFEGRVDRLVEDGHVRLDGGEAGTDELITEAAVDTPSS